jgi:hypothetical protein
MPVAGPAWCMPLPLGLTLAVYAGLITSSFFAAPQPDVQSPALRSVLPTLTCLRHLVLSDAFRLEDSAPLAALAQLESFTGTVHRLDVAQLPPGLTRLEVGVWHVVNADLEQQGAREGHQQEQGGGSRAEQRDRDRGRGSGRGQQQGRGRDSVRGRGSGAAGGAHMYPQLQHLDLTWLGMSYYQPSSWGATVLAAFQPALGTSLRHLRLHGVAMSEGKTKAAGPKKRQRHGQRTSQRLENCQVLAGLTGLQELLVPQPWEGAGQALAQLVDLTRLCFRARFLVAPELEQVVQLAAGLPQLRRLGLECPWPESTARRVIQALPGCLLEWAGSGLRE